MRRTPILVLSVLVSLACAEVADEATDADVLGGTVSGPGGTPTGAPGPDAEVLVSPGAGLGGSAPPTPLGPDAGPRPPPPPPPPMGDCPAPLQYWPDADGDGHGDADALPVEACAAAPGYVRTNDDCDDAFAAVNPAAQETPGDGLDQDCDGSELCYVDADGDGAREPDGATRISPNTSCADPGEADQNTPATDCDDGNAGQGPGTEETCDGRDEDCDGEVDEGADCPCEAEAFNGRAFLFCGEPLGWVEAQVQCQFAGYDLATAPDAATDAFLHQAIARRGFADTWIGLSDRARERQWVWVDGAPLAYTHWDEGEPNNGGDVGEDCGVIMTVEGRAAQWDDRGCGDPRPYVCAVPLD
jgi:hypothetical protein